MSVINDMLRDLDQRHAPESGNSLSDTERSTLESMIEPNKKLSAFQWFIIVMIVVAVSLSALYLGNIYIEKYGLDSKRTHALDKQVPDTKTLTATETIKQKTETQDEALSKVMAKEPSLKRAGLSKPALVITKPVEMGKDVKTKSLLSSRKTENNKINHKLAGSDLANTEISKNGSVKKISPKNVSPKVVLTKPHSVEKIASSAKRKQRAEAMIYKSPNAKNIMTKTGGSIAGDSRTIAANTVKVQTKLSPQEQDKAMANRALQFFQTGESREAYRAIYNFISTHAVDIKSRIILASQLLNEDRINEAGDVIMNSSTDEDPDFRQMKARWLVIKGENKLAIITLQNKLPDIAQYSDYYALLASYYQQFGYPKLALKTYSDLVQFDENIADWWAGFAIAADQSQQPLQAELGYKRAIQLPNLSAGLIDFVKQRLNNLSETLNH